MSVRNAFLFLLIFTKCLAAQNEFERLNTLYNSKSSSMPTLADLGTENVIWEGYRINPNDKAWNDFSLLTVFRDGQKVYALPSGVDPDMPLYQQDPYPLLAQSAYMVSLSRGRQFDVRTDVRAQAFVVRNYRYSLPDGSKDPKVDTFDMPATGLFIKRVNLPSRQHFDLIVKGVCEDMAGCQGTKYKYKYGEVAAMYYYFYKHSFSPKPPVRVPQKWVPQKWVTGPFPDMSYLKEHLPQNYWITGPGSPNWRKPN